MLSTDEYRLMASAYLSGLKTFIKIDRSDALFVSDAPRRSENFEDCYLPTLMQRFLCTIKNDLLYLTPKFENVPPSLTGVCIRILKLEGYEREKEIRTNLAVSMRNKNTAEINFLTKLLEGGIPT